MEYTINVGGKLMDMSSPKVMGILNVTPDSLFSGSRKQTEQEITERCNQIIDEGGEIIDVGAFSTIAGAPASKPPAYPTHRMTKVSAKL